MPEIDDTDQQIAPAEGPLESPAEEASVPVEEPADDTSAASDQQAEDVVAPLEELAEPGPAPAAIHPAPEAPDAALVEGVSGGVTWIPFAVYLACWVALAGLSAYLLQGATPDSPAQWMPAYEPLLLGGLGLTVLGPLMSLATWLVARMSRSAAARRGLFASVMTRGALTTFFGVLIWVGTLYVLELLGSGWAL